jgi:hypothetical protein
LKGLLEQLVVSENSLPLLDHRGHAYPTKSGFCGDPFEFTTAEVNSACEILRSAPNLTRHWARLAFARGRHGPVFPASSFPFSCW